MSGKAGAFAGFLAYRAFVLFLAVLPRRAVLALGSGLGRLVCRIDPKHRRIVESNLAVAFAKEKTPAAGAPAVEGSGIETNPLVKKSIDDFDGEIVRHDPR